MTETAAQLRRGLLAETVRPGDVVMVKGSNGSNKALADALIVAAMAATYVGEGRGPDAATCSIFASPNISTRRASKLNLLKYLTFRGGMSVVTAPR